MTPRSRRVVPLTSCVLSSVNVATQETPLDRFNQAGGRSSSTLAKHQSRTTRAVHVRRDVQLAHAADDVRLLALVGMVDDDRDRPVGRDRVERSPCTMNGLASFESSMMRGSKTGVEAEEGGDAHRTGSRKTGWPSRRNQAVAGVNWASMTSPRTMR